MMKRRGLTLSLLLLAAFLRFYQLAGQSLWSDEGNSLVLARRGFVEIAQRTSFDIHPPLYYWLLSVWVAVLGDSEIGLRSLSGVLGVGLVGLIYLLGTELFNRQVGLIAALLGAVSPFQIYYSQEARMYMLLAVLSALTIWLGMKILAAPRNGWVQLLYVLTIAAGLYTHYAYPLILLVINLVVLVQLFKASDFSPFSFLFFRWIPLQIIPLLFYLPWLPTAWRQLTSWPAERQLASVLEMVTTLTGTLLFGLTWSHEPGLLSIGGLIILLLIATIGPNTLKGAQQNREFDNESENLSVNRLLLGLWLLLPVLLTIFIYSPAFLKFLLVASPPLCLMLALAVVGLRTRLRPRWLATVASGAVLGLLLSASSLSLYYYFTDKSFARDNYRGIVQFIKAVGDEQDVVVLNAEGQQDVFGYYAERESLQLPIYPLPRRRPLDQAETVAELNQVTAGADKIYAVYWATQQADPNGVIEGWLDDHLFKASDRWYGNVRLVSYATPQLSRKPKFVETDFYLDSESGRAIHLTGVALEGFSATPGNILRVGLQWQIDEPLDRDYTIFVQLLDAHNHLVGQHDAQPVTPTLNWPVGTAIEDGHGLYVEPGTPPGLHRLIVGLYDSRSGQRLSVGENGSDFVTLAEIEVTRPAKPLPLEAFEIQQYLGVDAEGVRLWGVDIYKVGHRSTPDTPLGLGDPLHVVAYWSRLDGEEAVPDQVSIRVAKIDGSPTGIELTGWLGGIDYRPAKWQPGEIVRAQYDLVLAGLESGWYQLHFSLDGEMLPAVSRAFEVR